MSQEKIKNRIDYKTLSETLSIQTKYDDDDAMLVYIKDKLSKMNVDVQEDAYGNIYVTKGIASVYPCVVAHTDTVQSVLTNVAIYRNEDTIFAFDPIKRTQHGIGGDDKVGVYITLQLLNDIQIMKAVFYRNEEIGCLGSRYSMKFHADWYKDIGYVMMADRKGNTDAIRVSGGLVITSEDFLSACEDQLLQYGYTPAIGICTDVDVLVDYNIGVSAINFSCGYHEPHSSKEIVSLKDVNRCYNLMYDILLKYPDQRFPHTCERPVYKGKAFGRSSRYDLHTLNSKYESPIANSIRKKQQPLPLIFGDKVGSYDNFIETDIVKGKRIYEYKGVKSLPFTGYIVHDKCGKPVLDNVFFLPYEGRAYCTTCNNFVDDTQISMLLEHLEVEDRDEIFVYSSYASGWLKKSGSAWNKKLRTWLTDDLPFN